jgi:hypothetical protein
LNELTDFGLLTYGLFDDPFVALQALILGPDATHLNGEIVSGDDRTSAFINTAMWFVPIGGVATRSEGIVGLGK